MVLCLMRSLNKEQEIASGSPDRIAPGKATGAFS